MKLYTSTLFALFISAALAGCSPAVDDPQKDAAARAQKAQQEQEATAKKKDIVAEMNAAITAFQKNTPPHAREEWVNGAYVPMQLAFYGERAIETTIHALLSENLIRVQTAEYILQHRDEFALSGEGLFSTAEDYNAAMDLVARREIILRQTAAPKSAASSASK